MAPINLSKSGVRKRPADPQRAASAPRAKGPVRVEITAEELRKLRAEIAKLRGQQEPAPIIPPEAQGPVSKELPEKLRGERESFAQQLPIPGRNAPVFNLVNDFLHFGVTPWADPMVPAYVLDKNYRIVDWNIAFGLAFDRTMEGRRGMSVLEWVYFLDNYEECLKKAAKDFSDPANLPRVHVERIEYTSPRFGPIRATKRAYQMPKDDGEMLGWLVILETDFEDLNTTQRFRRDLFTALRQHLTWSEYALSYDRVLLSSKVYPELLKHILGEQVPAGGMGQMDRIRRGARILDLGAGTGNVSLLLAKQQRGHVIFAIENNRMMLDMLRAKCDSYLRTDDNGPGILAVKQDVNTLFGLPDEAFDYAVLNNVLYALDDPGPCLRYVRKALKAKGEIRVSGPQKKTNLKQLFGRIEADLSASGKMAELREEYVRVWEINQAILGPSLYRWNADDVKKMLLAAGFAEITYATEAAYAGQAMIVVARK